MVEGDNRTVGIGFENFKIVTTPDRRMIGKIVIALTRGGTEGQPDGLAWGTHAWMPELAGTMDVSRDGAHYEETMVQPRSLHINNLPIMAMINVVNLEDSLTKRVLLEMEADEEEAGAGTGTDSGTTGN